MGCLLSAAWHKSYPIEERSLFKLSLKSFYFFFFFGDINNKLVARRILLGSVSERSLEVMDTLVKFLCCSPAHLACFPLIHTHTRTSLPLPFFDRSR